MKAREGDISSVLRIAVVEKSGPVQEKLKKMKKNHCGLMVSLHLMRMELQRATGERKEKRI